MKASVIICTYNRRSFLQKAISSLQKQDFTRDQYEIIIVDNNSADGTEKVVKEIAASSPVKISYITEKRQGLSFARNTGIDNSSGEIVAFIDDDAEADEKWLKNIVSAFYDPEVYCAGGVVKGIWDIPRPEWLPDWALHYLSIRDFNTLAETKKFTYPNYPIGTNIAFRRSAFDEFGRFSEDLGRIGSSLLSNEETELCLRIEGASKILQFVPEALVRHYVAPARLNKEWFYNRLFSQGRSEAILDLSHARDISERMHWYSSVIFNYHSSPKPDFTTEARYRMTIGYIGQLCETLPTSTHPEDNLNALRKVTESLFASHKQILEQYQTDCLSQLASVTMEKESLQSQLADLALENDNLRRKSDSTLAEKNGFEAELTAIKNTFAYKVYVYLRKILYLILRKA